MSRRGVYRVASALSLALSLALAGPGPAQAAQGDLGAAVSEARLDTMRGGFDDGRGLRASFGLERATFINGTLVASQSIHIADLSRISEAQAGQLRSALAGMTIVNNGAGATLALAQAQSPAGATVIQNSLNDQSIKSLTVLNATTNSLGLLRAFNSGALLRDALTAPLVARP